MAQFNADSSDFPLKNSGCVALALQPECRKNSASGNSQRYQCQQCCRVFANARDQTLKGMYLPIEKAEMVLRMLLESNSVERLTEMHHPAILKLLLLRWREVRTDHGKQDRQRAGCETSNVTSYGRSSAEAKARAPQGEPGLGDADVFVAIERHSKPVLHIVLGKRD